jgi:transposase
MYNITYAMLVKNSKNPEIIREKMVKRYYELRNYSQVAKEFQTQSKRVKFWVERFEKEGIEGLKNKSKAPHHIPHKTPKEIEEKIKEIAKSKKHLLAKTEFNLSLKNLELKGQPQLLTE